MKIKSFKPDTAGTEIVSNLRIAVRVHRDNKRHRRIVARYRDRYSLCLRCLVDNKLTASQEIHHIKGVADGGATEPANLMALCITCHEEIETMTQAEQLGIKQAGEAAYETGGLVECCWR